jgi:chromate transport protein ChrA
MMSTILIAIAAGCASALMFASIISGMLLSILLVYFSPLPLMVAALSWGPTSALVGGLSAGIILALSFNLMQGLNYVLMVAAPAFWLGHLSLLAQPAAAPANGSEPPLDWYPVGRIVLWATLIAASIMILALLITGSSAEETTAKLRELALQTLNSFNRSGLEADDKQRVASFMARAAPLVLVSATSLMYLLNLWVAGTVARTSHRLRRPWPDLHGIALPHSAIVVLAAALLLSFMGGMPALLAQIISAALVTAYMLVGLAVLHAVTSLSSGRIWWRLAAYGVILMFIWPLLLLPVIGLLDAVFGLRRRFSAASTPPTPSS